MASDRYERIFCSAFRGDIPISDAKSRKHLLQASYQILTNMLAGHRFQSIPWR
ncbi:unnamed protein product [Periconia digitata]|uniref:Uncharacterized protein n=1 Tax=Periconia digitata TaxID=1303443 RepID=A0A9W4XIY3_9PLEO|nr:unnamed protein product [Periconia digitata]